MMPIIDLAPVGIAVAAMDAGYPLIYVNAAFEQMTGYSSVEALGKNCRYLQGSDRLQPQIAQMRDAIRQGAEISVTLRNYRKDGTLFWNKLHLLPAGAPGQEPTSYIGLMQDVTDPKTTVERLERMLQIDQLTGVLNRYAFVDRLGELRADPGATLLVVKVDVAQFHDINTGYGYDVGDVLLKQVADRLKGAGAAAVGRLDADEFGVAYTLASRHEADALLDKVSATLAPRYVVPGAVVSVRFAVGYTVGETGADPLVLVRRAGAALKESRSTKLREVRGFDSGAEMRSRNRIRMRNELQQALAQDEFAFAYQPKVELATGALVGAEALLRWKHGLFGEQRPDSFIGVAEDTGIILDIGAWGLPAAARFVSRINRNAARPVSVAVNVSTVEFIHRDMVRFVAKVLESSEIDPSWITLELTESLMAESSTRISDIFKSLRALGIGVAIDDFGTGYSNLRYLEEFPVSEVKLDHSFIRGISSHVAKRIIVEAVVRLGRELDMTVVAEGIETLAERDILCDMGCPQGQGFLFSHPLPEDTFAALVRDGLPLGPPRSPEPPR